jgi:hypothetical protein
MKSEASTRYSLASTRDASAEATRRMPKGKNEMPTINKPRPRKTSTRSKGEPRATQATSDRLKELWATPEFRDKMKQRDQARIAAAKRNPAKFSRYGVPDGMRRPEAKLAWARARELADRFIAVLKRNGVLPDHQYEVDATPHAGTGILIPLSDDGMAEAALREAFVLAMGPSGPAVKAAAINTVLTYTRARPATQTRLRQGSATDFLDGLVADQG